MVFGMTPSLPFNHTDDTVVPLLMHVGLINCGISATTVEHPTEDAQTAKYAVELA